MIFNQTTLFSSTTGDREPGMERILVIEDDDRVQRALRRLFNPEGYDVQSATDGQAGVDSVRSQAPTAVVLDLRLPKMSGRDVCREIKQISPDVPVIILSAASDVIDKVSLLELGADDYVTKPFSPKELLARVRAVIRRSTRPPNAVTRPSFSFGNVTVDFVTMEVTRGGQPVTLTAQEFKTLKFLSQNPERVLSREEL